MNYELETNSKNITALAPCDNVEKLDKPKKPDYPDWFEEIWKHYPIRAGGDNKKLAFQKANGRIKDGKTAGELYAAVDRYKYFVVATGKASTEYVKQAATFFGSIDNINNPWTAPNLQAHQNANTPKSPIERFIKEHYPNGIQQPDGDGHVGCDDIPVR